MTKKQFVDMDTLMKKPKKIALNSSLFELQSYIKNLESYQEELEKYIKQAFIKKPETNVYKSIEQWFGILMEHLGDMITFHDFNGNYLHYIGPKKYNIEARDVIGKSPYNFFENNIAKQIVDEIKKVAASGIPSRMDILVNWQGKLTWFEEHIIPFIQDGKTTHVLKICTDITHRKQIEDSLKISEERFRAIFEQAAVGVALIKTATGEYIRINQKYCDFLGYTQEEMLHKTFMDVTFHEDVSTNIQRNKQLIDGIGNEFSIEKRYVRKDGEILWGKLTISPLWKEANLLEDYYHIAIVENINEQKLQQLSLINSEEKLQNLIQDMPVGVLLQGPNAEILLCNPKSLELLGLSFDQLIGKSSFDEDWNVIHEDGTAFIGNTHPVPQAILQKKAQNNVVMGVYNPKTKQRIWLLVDAIPQFNKDNSVKQVVCTFIDISARKKAEEDLKLLNEELEKRVAHRTKDLVKAYEELQEVEEKYQIVADNTYDWEFWLDPNEQIIYSSPSCFRITGYNAEEFIKNPELFFNIIYPEDLISFRDHRAGDCNNKDDNFELQYRIVRPDGDVRWIGHVCQPVFDSNGKFLGNRGSNRDITERKKMANLLITSEQKYRLLSENISDGLFICRNSSFSYVNDAICKILGYSRDEFIEMSFLQIVPSELHSAVQSFFSSQFENNEVKNLEFDCIKKDKSKIIVEVLLNYIASEDLIYGVMHDVTEKKQIQKNIVKAIIQTEEKERAYFSKELHDGLGPLLSSIKLYLQWSNKADVNKPREEIIAKAEQILEDALIVVKEISNKLSPHLLIYYGLTSAVQSYIKKISGTNIIKINFVSNFNRRLDSEIEASLYRAIIECINNTLKYANAKNIDIVITESESDLIIEYKDDGIGFNIQETLQASKGLGLFNLNSRIQTIGGKIHLSSILNKGVYYQIAINI